eukprot:10359600-Alexandrium_andersonii.AAC.1
MSASLVGSEMCIRDSTCDRMSAFAAVAGERLGDRPTPLKDEFVGPFLEELGLDPVVFGRL